MNGKIFISILAFAVSVSAFAALPPYAQTAREIKAILENDEVVRQLGNGAPISSVTREDNNYAVVTSRCALTVAVVYIVRPDAPPSPAEFRLNVGRASCLP